MEDDGGVRGDFTNKAKKRSYYQEIASHPVASALDAAEVLGLAALATDKGRDQRARRSPRARCVAGVRQGAARG